MFTLTTFLPNNQGKQNKTMKRSYSKSHSLSSKNNNKNNNINILSNYYIQYIQNIKKEVSTMLKTSVSKQYQFIKNTDEKRGL